MKAIDAVLLCCSLGGSWAAQDFSWIFLASGATLGSPFLLRVATPGQYQTECRDHPE